MAECMTSRDEADLLKIEIGECVDRLERMGFSRGTVGAAMAGVGLGIVHAHRGDARALEIVDAVRISIMAGSKALRPSPLEWQPWKNAPRDGRIFIARCNDKVTLLLLSWGCNRQWEVGWCGQKGDKLYGDGLFEPNGGWTELPADGSQ